MGCDNWPTSQNMAQVRATWNPVPADKRYEEKVVQYPTTGRITRMTRVAGQTTNYPHYTEYYSANGTKESSRTHYSTAEGSGGTHTDAHKTAQAILDDLDEAISSLRSNR